MKMSFLLKCNVFSVSYQASRRGLPYNLHHVTRRSIALGCKMKQESQPNNFTIPENKGDSAILRDYLKLVGNNTYLSLTGLLNYRKFKFLRKETQTGNISSINALLFLKCCGAAAVHIKPAMRSTYLHEIWNVFNTLGVPLDVSHFNAFLKSQIENEEEIDFEEFVREMKSKNVNLNRVTYQQFLTYYCYNNKLGEATKILEVVKANEIPLNEQIFNALILGHGVANDTAAADDLFRIMKQKNLSISSATYLNYICGLARSGNINKISQILEESSSNGISFSTEMKYEIVYYLIINGHKDFAINMLSKENGFVPKNEKEELILQFRLLHKMKTDELTDILAIHPKTDDQKEKLWLAYSYILNNEGLLPFYKFHILCNEKGVDLSIRQMRGLLRVYNVRDYDNLESVANYFKVNEKVGNDIFIPFLKNHIKNKDIVHLVRTLKAIQDGGALMNIGFLRDYLANPLKLSLDELSDFKDLMEKNRIPTASLMRAFLLSAIENGDLNFTEGLLERIYVPKYLLPINETLIVGVEKGHEACVATCLKSWYFKSLVKKIKPRGELATSKPGETEPDTLSLTKEESKEYTAAILQILKDSKAGSQYDILQKFASMEVPLPAEVIASIKKLWVDEKTRELVDNIQTPQMTLADVTNSNIYKARFVVENRRLGKEGEAEAGGGRGRGRITRTRCEKELAFESLVQSGNLTEAEEMLDKFEEVRNYHCYALLVREFIKSGEEGKVMCLLQRFVKVARKEYLGGEADLYLECEMLKRKMLLEFKTSCYKRYLIFNTGSFKYLLPMIRALDKDELSQALEYDVSSTLTSVGQWLIASVKSAEDDLVLKLITENMRLSLLQTLLFEVLPFLYGEKKFDIIDKIFGLVETRKYNSLISITRQLCSNDFSAFQREMDYPRYNLLRFIEGIENENAKYTLIQKILDPSLFVKCRNKNIYYEILLEHYKEKGEKPEKCLELWYKQQEENVEPKKMFLIKLAEILEMNDRPVEFNVPVILPPSFKDLDFDIPIFSTYVKRQLNELKNDDARSDRVWRLFKLVCLRSLRFDHLQILQKRSKDNEYMLGLLKDVKEYHRLRGNFLQENLLSYLVEKGITTRKRFRDGVQVEILAFFITNRMMSYIPSVVLLWYYWSRVKPFPELVEMVKPDRITMSFRRRFTQNYRSISLPQAEKKKFYEFLNENNLLLHFKEKEKINGKAFREAPSTSFPPEKFQEEEEEEEDKDEEEEEEEEESIEMEKSGFDDTDKMKKETRAPGLDPRN